MFIKSSKGYYFWEEFTKVDGIMHGFSTSKFGDMDIKNPKSNKHLRIFLKSFGTHDKSIVRMNQIHGDNVEVVSQKDSNRSLATVIDNADGLISSSKGVFLVGTFADCVPVLFLDKNKKIFGIVHAGWKGVYKEIVKRMIGEMIKYGSKPSNIMVGIGPSIRACCYNINKERERVFKDKFPKIDGIVKRKNGKIFLDLVIFVTHQLSEFRIPKKNILDCKICTKDNMSELYSFRGEHGKDSFGLSAAVIGKM